HEVKPGEMDVSALVRVDHEIGGQGVVVLMQAVDHHDNGKIWPAEREVVALPLPVRFGDHNGTSQTGIEVRRFCSIWHADLASRWKSFAVHGFLRSCG